MSAATPRDIALFLHYTYEQLAPSFGYETREASRTWDSESPNGKLMIAVCELLVKRWRIDLPPPPLERFQFFGTLNAGPKGLAQFAENGHLEIHQDPEDPEDLERFAEQSWDSQTRAIARLILVIARQQIALRAADQLAHGYVFSPEHAQYWKAREVTGKCAVCTSEHTDS